jgi:hypothetical protein
MSQVSPPKWRIESFWEPRLQDSSLASAHPCTSSGSRHRVEGDNINSIPHNNSVNEIDQPYDTLNHHLLIDDRVVKLVRIQRLGHSIFQNTMLSNILHQGGRKLFFPRLHLWYRPLPLLATQRWTVQIGVTDRCLQDLGDVQKIYSGLSTLQAVSKGDTVLSLDWDGYRITDGDEMYHTVWNNIEGTFTIKSPVDGTIDFISDNPDIMDEDQVLIEISTTETLLETFIESLVNEEEYNRWNESMPLGTFAQVNGLR